MPSEKWGSVIRNFGHCSKLIDTLSSSFFLQLKIRILMKIGINRKIFGTVKLGFSNNERNLPTSRSGME